MHNVYVLYVCVIVGKKPLGASLNLYKIVLGTAGKCCDSGAVPWVYVGSASGLVHRAKELSSLGES